MNTFKGSGQSLSRVRLSCDPMDSSLPDSLSMGFPRQECWSGLPFPSPGDLPTTQESNQIFLHCRWIFYQLSYQGSPKWSRAKANRVLPRERTGHSKHPLRTTQEKTLHMDITKWSILKSDWLYSLQPKMEKLYTVSKNKTRSCPWLRSWTPYCQIQT